METVVYDFVGGEDGQWRVVRMDCVAGEALAPVSHIKINESAMNTKGNGRWNLKGIISNLRYTEKSEKDQLTSIQQNLGRPEAKYAALIPMKKSDAWWCLAQDERREIFEKQSQHTRTGLKYLPAIARKLYHCRDIGEPFDFITWFEYAPSYADAFEDLVHNLRRTEEWNYVEREIDIRLVRA